MASASNPLNQSYSIDYSWSPCEILCYEGPKKHFNKCTEHYKKVQEEFSISESLKCLGEFVITVIDAVPVIGHLAFIIEMIAVSCFERQSDPAFNPLEQEDESSEQQQLALASLNSIEIEPELVNLETPDDCTTLFIACFKGDVDAVKSLIEKGVDVNITVPSDIVFFKEETEDGYKINDVISKGKTPLLIATQNRNAELVQLLLDSGAKLYFKPENYHTKNGAMLVLSSMEEYKFTCTRFPPTKNPEYYFPNVFSSYNHQNVGFIFKQAAMCGAKDLEKKRTLISVLSNENGLPADIIKIIYSAFTHAFTKFW